jgi:hypothetical protein
MTLTSTLLALMTCVAGLSVSSSLRAQPRESSTATEATPERRSERTLRRIPSGVDTYTAFIEGQSLGAAGVGVLDGRPGEERSVDASGGIRFWGSFLDRFVIQGEAGKDAKGRFAPSVTLAARLLGDGKSGWAAGVLGRYRTEGFSTVEGEVEGGLLGGYARNRLHLDAGLIAGVGIEESEADAELLFRLGYDLAAIFRLGH